MKHLESLDPSKFGPRDLKMLVETQQVLDNLARRSFRLDEPNPEARAVQIVIANISPAQLRVACGDSIISDLDAESAS